MTTHLHLLRLAFPLLAGGLLATSAQAYVVEDDATLVTISSTEQQLRLNKTIGSTGTGLFAIQVVPVNANSFSFAYWGIAEAYALYTVAAGEVVDASFKASHAPIITNVQGPYVSTQQFQLNQTRLFAYWDAGMNTRPETFGWVGLTLTSSGLVASSGASSLGEGIIAGTTRAVPEPGTAALGLLGGLGLLWAAGRRRTVVRG